MNGLKKFVLSTTSIVMLVTLSACGGKNAQSPASASSSSMSVTTRKRTSSARKSLAASSQTNKTTATGTCMNLAEIKTGNYRSLTGSDWKMIGAKVNYHKGNGMEFDTSQVNGQLSRAKDKITNGTLTVTKNSITVDGKH